MNKRPGTGEQIEGILSRLQELGPVRLGVMGGLVLLSAAVLCIPFSNWSLVQPHRHEGSGPQKRGAEVAEPQPAVFQSGAQGSLDSLETRSTPQPAPAPTERTASAEPASLQPKSAGTPSTLPAGGITTIGADERKPFKAKAGLDENSGKGQPPPEANAAGIPPATALPQAGTGRSSTLSAETDSSPRSPKLKAKALGAVTPVQATSFKSSGVRFGGVESSYSQAPKVEPSSLDRAAASISASPTGATPQTSSQATSKEGESSSLGGRGSGGGSSGGGSGSSDPGLENLTTNAQRCSEAQKRLHPKIDKETKEYANLRARHGANGCGKSCNQGWDQKCRYNRCTVCDSGFSCGDWIWKKVCEDGLCTQVKVCSHQFSRFCNCNSLWCDTRKKCAEVNDLQRELSDACRQDIQPLDCNK